MIACVYGRLPIIDFLIARGSDINCVNSYGDSSLNISLERHRIKAANHIRYWPTCMGILVLQELSLYYLLDFQTLVDLYHYMI